MTDATDRHVYRCLSNQLYKHTPCNDTLHTFFTELASKLAKLVSHIYADHIYARIPRKSYEASMTWGGDVTPMTPLSWKSGLTQSNFFELQPWLHVVTSSVYLDWTTVSNSSLFQSTHTWYIKHKISSLLSVKAFTIWNPQIHRPCKSFLLTHSTT